jgi:hypothetical protein
VNFASELTFWGIQCQMEMTVIEAVFTDPDREMPIISPEILNRELEISRRSIHAIQYLQKSMCILTQDHSWDNGNFMTLISADQLVIPAFKERRLFIQAVVYAGGECGTQGHVDPPNLWAAQLHGAATTALQESARTLGQLFLS